jgi:hypothetical protein
MTGRLLRALAHHHTPGGVIERVGLAVDACLLYRAGDPVCDSEHEVVVAHCALGTPVCEALACRCAGRVPLRAGQRLQNRCRATALYGTCCHPSVRGCTGACQ